MTMLPDCMMPDGAQPRRAYTELQDRLARSEKFWRELITAKDEIIAPKDAEITQLRESRDFARRVGNTWADFEIQDADMRTFERGSGISVTGPRVTWSAARKAMAGVKRGAYGGGLKLRHVQSTTWFGRCPAFKPRYAEDEKRGRMTHCAD